MVHSLGEGVTLIFSYMRRLRSFFGVQNFEFQYVLGFSDSEYFLGYGEFVDNFKGSFLCILGSFLKVKVQKGSIFGVAKTSVLERLKFLIFFWVNCRCWVRAYASRKMRVPCSPLGYTITNTHFTCNTKYC